MRHAQTIDRYVCVEPLRVSRGFLVARCWDPVREEEVAVKSIHAHRLRNPKYRERLRREAQIADRARHPGLVKLLDCDQKSLPRFCVFGFCAGGSLRLQLSPERPLPSRQAVELCCQVASALHHLHMCGYVHLDVKADNVLLSADGHAVLCDYGMSRSFRTLRRARGYLGGTPGTMSPEQAGFFHRRGADQRSDVFAVGALLYQLLTGRMPVAGNRRAAYLRNLALLAKEPVRPPAECSPELATVLSRSLAFHPTSRYRNASLLADALGRAFSCLDAGGAPAGRAEAGGR